MSRLRPGMAAVMASALFIAAGSVSTIAQPAPAPQPKAEQATDPFGEEVTLTAKVIVYKSGSANWDTAFETLVETFKTLQAFLDKQGIKPSGPLMTIYTATDDTGFQFQAAIPVAEEPKNMPQGDIAVGKTPEGRALKFMHRGSYDSMDSTYEAITNLLEEKRLEARDLFVEQYLTDPLATAEDKLVIEVYVPIK